MFTSRLGLDHSMKLKGINNHVISKKMSCSPSLILTLTRGADILFEKLRHETGG